MRKKLNSSEEERLNQIYNLIQEQEITQEERHILVSSKDRIEKGGMFESHMINLRNALLPLVVSQKISPKVLDFYLKLRKDRAVGVAEGISLAVGMSQTKF